MNLCLLWEVVKRSLLVLCLLWEDQYWSFHNKQRTNDDLLQQTKVQLFVVRNKGPLKSFVCCERSNWSLFIVRGLLTTSLFVVRGCYWSFHNKQMTNNEPLTTVKGCYWPLFIVRGRYWSFVCCEKGRYWSFVCCERTNIGLCLLWEVQYWSFVCCERSNIGPLFVVKGPILVLCLLWEVQYWSFVCCEMSNWSRGLSQLWEVQYWSFVCCETNIGPLFVVRGRYWSNCERSLLVILFVVRGPIFVLSQQEDQYWSLTTNRGPIDPLTMRRHYWSFFVVRGVTTSHNKQRSNNDFSQWTKVQYWSLFVVRGCYWSFVCCERSLLVLSQQMRGRYWSFVCCERSLLVLCLLCKGSILVLCLTFVCCERSLLVICLLWEVKHWSINNLLWETKDQ